MIRAYDDYGNVVDLVEWEKQIKADAIDECTETIRKGFEELLQSPWANTKYLREFDLSVKEVFEVIDHLILRKDIEQLKENKDDTKWNNGNVFERKQL